MPLLWDANVMLVVMCIAYATVNGGLLVIFTSDALVLSPIVFLLQLPPLRVRSLLRAYVKLLLNPQQRVPRYTGGQHSA